LYRELTFERKLKAHLRLVSTGFGNAMRAYFSVRTRAAMNLIGTALEVVVWGVLGMLMKDSPIEVAVKSFYMTPDMVSFMLSGLIINRLVDLAQIFSPWFFRGSYKTYHNRPFNIWIMAFAKNINEMFFWRVVGVTMYIVLAAFLFRIQLNYASWGFWLVIVIGALFRLGLNLFTAGWTILTRGEEDPINWFYNITSRLFTGELIPVNYLKTVPTVGPFLTLISDIHPKTYVQTYGRQAAIGGKRLSTIAPHLWVPCVAAAFFLVLGYLTLKTAIQRAKREGIMKWG